MKIKSLNIDNWLYVNDEDNKTRYVLGKRSDSPLVCFGINPSTAEPNNLDPTLKSVERVAEKNDFESFLMLNIYPQRSTDPSGIHEELDLKIHKNNLFHIEGILSKYNPPIIWAAWGTLINTRPYLLKCLEDIYTISFKYNCKWVSVGKLSKDGHPHHPLYLSAETEPETFDILGYLKKLKQTT